MLSTLGALAGEFAAGTLTVFFPERMVLLGTMLICAGAALVFIGGGGKQVALIYNRAD